VASIPVRHIAPSIFPSILNRTIVLDNEPNTVIGILPAGSLAFEPSTCNFHWMASFARLKEGVSKVQRLRASTELPPIAEIEKPDQVKG
jgi:hypothetical protein